MEHDKKREKFNNQLKLCRSYLADIRHYENQMVHLYDEMANVKAIQYDKIPGTPNPHANEVRMLEFSEQIALVESEKKRIERLLKPLEKTVLNDLKRLDPFITDIVLYQYGLKIDGKSILLNGRPHTIREMGEVYHYSNNGMWQLLKREIEKL